jgi:tyrosine-specific transport protein
MIADKIEVGDLVYELGNISKFHSIQLLVWWVSLLAIITSIIGVARGLYDSFFDICKGKILISNNNLLSLLIAFSTIFPAYLIVRAVPNAFIIVLGFAGMILSVIAIILPIYLLLKIKPVNLYYSELNSNWKLFISLIAGIIVIFVEFMNIIAV